MALSLQRTLRFSSLASLGGLSTRFISRAMSSGKPVILCGRTQNVARGVKGGLEPEYEVIHVIFSPAQGVSDIPLILQNKMPSAEPNLGTQNYSKTPVAVILGGGYDDAMFKQMYDAAKGKGKAVPWLRPDLSVPAPPLGPGYGPHMVGRVKACLGRLDAEGKLSEEREEGEVVLF